MAETSGLLNRRTGNSRTEGSNPSVSATRWFPRNLRNLDQLCHFGIGGRFRNRGRNKLVNGTYTLPARTTGQKEIRGVAPTGGVNA